MSMPRTFTMLGTSGIEVLVSDAQSGGAISVIAESCGPGEGPPPHIHAREEEFLMPLEGSFDYFDGTAWGPMRVQGEFTKRDNLHTWRKGEDLQHPFSRSEEASASDRFTGRAQAYGAHVRP